MKYLLVLINIVFLSGITGNYENQNKELFQSWAERPPMGWNSYDCFGAAVYESDVRANADYMAENLKNFGWETGLTDEKASEILYSYNHSRVYVRTLLKIFKRLKG